MAVSGSAFVLPGLKDPMNWDAFELKSIPGKPNSSEDCIDMDSAYIASSDLII